MLFTIKRFWKLLRGVRWAYLISTVAIAICMGVFAVRPRVIQVFIDYALSGKPADVSPQVQGWMDWLGPQAWWQDNLWIILPLLLSLSVVVMVLMFTHRILTFWASYTISRRLKDRLYAKINALPLEFYDDHERGDLLQRCTSDVETIRMFLSQVVHVFGRAFFMLPFSVLLMWPMSPMLSLLSMAAVPIIITMTTMYYCSIRGHFKQSDEAEGDMTAMLSESLSAVRVIRAFARQDHQHEKFQELNEEYRRKGYKLMSLSAKFWGFLDMVCMGQLALILGVAAWKVRTDPNFTVGMMTAFMFYVRMFVWPIRGMGRMLADMGKASVSLERIDEILDATNETAPADPVTPLPERISGTLEVRGLSFSHNNQTDHALKNVSFSVKPGETLAIVGPSGAGKSTVVNLLLRLYDFEEGTILLDGMDLTQLPREFVRGQIGSVLQEPFLYSRTIGENIKFGNSSARKEDLSKAVQTASLHESIQRFEEGLETMIGERGVTLSGGQRQRVALARAILRNPPVLILDDALSAVDTHTERLILQALRSRHGRCTTIVIAHRMSTLSQADFAIVLEKGCVTQAGTHKELIAVDGLYKRLWEIQSALQADLRDELGQEGGAM